MKARQMTVRGFTDLETPLRVDDEFVMSILASTGHETEMVVKILAEEVVLGSDVQSAVKGM